MNKLAMFTLIRRITWGLCCIFSCLSFAGFTIGAWVVHTTRGPDFELTAGIFQLALGLLCVITAYVVTRAIDKMLLSFMNDADDARPERNPKAPNQPVRTNRM